MMQSLIQDAVQKLFDVTANVVLTRPEPQFGDFATNVALQLAKPLGGNPREIAQAIAEALDETGQFAQVSVAGPGFINLTLTNQSLLELVKRAPRRSRTGSTIVIETNNPNPFKPMHIGHAYNAVLGDSLANMLAVDGGTVHRVSYHGDVGTHVGKSMWAILEETGGDVTKLEAVEPSERNAFLGTMYARGSAAAKQDEAVKRQIDELAKQSFRLDDPTFTAIYDLCAAWSYQQIDAVVARLGSVQPERRYVESETEAPGKALIIANTPRVFTESDGAYIFEGSKYGSFDNVYIGSHGNGLYGAHDMGLIRLKYADYPDLDESIVPTGGEQAAYFVGVIAASEQAIPALKGKLRNIPTGLVKLTTGKMSSRTGDVITIEWLFDEFKRAIEARGGQPSDDIIAGALRYQFLKVKIGGDVIFDVNEAVSLTGNTGSYLQYAHARARRILENVGGEVPIVTELHSEDRALVRKLGEYGEIIELATRELAPHHICTYLFELAQQFNRYYETNQVVGSDREAHRAGLVKLYADKLASGLAVLGIHAPDQM